MKPNSYHNSPLIQEVIPFHQTSYGRGFRARKAAAIGDLDSQWRARQIARQDRDTLQLPTHASMPSFSYTYVPPLAMQSRWIKSGSTTGIYLSFWLTRVQFSVIKPLMYKIMGLPKVFIAGCVSYIHYLLPRHSRGAKTGIFPKKYHVEQRMKQRSLSTRKTIATVLFVAWCIVLGLILYPAITKDDTNSGTSSGSNSNLGVASSKHARWLANYTPTQNSNESARTQSSNVESGQETVAMNTSGTSTTTSSPSQSSTGSSSSSSGGSSTTTSSSSTGIPDVTTPLPITVPGIPVEVDGKTVISTAPITVTLN